MTAMAVSVRPARPDDAVAELLYASAHSYYDAFAGGEQRARGLLRRLYPRDGHSASWQVCLVAEVEGAPAGVMAGFPARESPRYSRHFVALAMRHLAPGAWPGAIRHLRAASRVSPQPPEDSWYVDALAVREDWRRRGVGGALLDAAEQAARGAGLPTLALDTGLENDGAQAVYLGRGFRERTRTHAPDPATALALGGVGFVSYVKAL